MLHVIYYARIVFSVRARKSFDHKLFINHILRDATFLCFVTAPPSRESLVSFNGTHDVGEPSTERKSTSVAYDMVSIDTKQL